MPKQIKNSLQKDEVSDDCTVKVTAEEILEVLEDLTQEIGKTEEHVRSEYGIQMMCYWNAARAMIIRVKGK